MSTLNDNQAQLFLDPNFGVVATLKEDGSPQSSVVWLDWDGENVVFNTTRPRAKGRNDPHGRVIVRVRPERVHAMGVE